MEERPVDEGAPAAMEEEWEVVAEEEEEAESGTESGGNAINKEEAEVAKNEANIAYKAKDYRKAIAGYQEAISKLGPCPDAAPIYGNLAAARMMLLQYREAAEDCEKAIEADPNFTKAYFRKASALKKHGAFEEALKAYNYALARDPNNADQLQDKHEAEVCLKKVQRAKELIEKKQWSSANALLDSVLNVGNQDFDLKRLKVECLVGAGKYEQAYSMTQGMMRQSPNSPALLSLRARTLYMMGNVEHAIKHLAEAARQDPDNKDYLKFIRQARLMESTKEKGTVAFKAGDMKAAIEAWTEAAQIDPSNKVYISRLFCNCANAYARLKNHQKAVESATAAIKADPTYAKAYMRRASSLFDIGGVENLEACQKDYDNVANMLDEAGQNDVQRKLRDVKAALKQARRKDFYKILGISRSADENEIKKAYRKCALKYHPDKAAGKSEQEKEEAEKIFRDVGEAYEVLSDPAKKQRYDSGVDLEDLDNPHAGHHHHGGFGGGGMHGIDPHILFQMFAQQQAARGGMGGSQGMPFSF